MTKKRSAPKTKSSFSSMGRILFYLVAITVACCAVAVVLFETDAGLELVASLRGAGDNTEDDARVKTSTSEKKDESSEQHTVGESNAKQASGSEKSGERAATSSETSTSSNVAEQTNKAREKETATKDGPNNEAVKSDGDKKTEEVVEDKPVQERTRATTEGEAGMREETGGVETAEETEETGGGETDSVGDPEFDSDEGRKLWEGSDEEMNDGDEQVQQPGNESDEYTDEDDEEETVEDRVDKEEGVSEPGEELDQSTSHLSIGDSLDDNERGASVEEEAKQQHEEIEEPEGPPIDEYPRHAQRGLRGDYGGKDCKDNDRNCKPWAESGECTKNPIWMEVNCKRSCNVCDCSDNHVKCNEWARGAECYKNADYMNKNCMKSCGRC